ncbi:MAG: SPFH domain-containing protein [Anaerolineales bacterium]|uniref:SPFH domain-containing protein n=1 Tax=Candidatus Villigracilis proximus TaxID=3140683 RepID=UPI0031370460|nr:SPFH domain-containing protein [Anaerolineales bacterium]
MARIFDVIEYANEMSDEIVHRFPEEGIGDFRIGSQVIVRESQSAVFFRDGNALDVFKPGRHTIATANIPLLIDWVGKAFNDRTPFPAEVYFVSRKEFANEKWGTPQAIIVRNPNMGFGVALLQGFGTYSFQVKDPQQFVTQIVGAQGAYRTSEIEERLKMILLSKLQDVLGETGAKGNPASKLIGLPEEIGAAVRVKAKEDFEAIGLTLKTFYIGSLKPSQKSAQELRDMGMLDMSTYTQLQAADAMRDAAQNQSGGAGLTAGIGAGMGIGNLMGQALQGGMQNNSQGGSAPSGAKMPDIMTPAEAAQFMKVTEEDIMAAITDGSLKAKKVGKAFRISKDNLDSFMNS